MLTSDDSSLVVDRLCDKTKQQKDCRFVFLLGHCSTKRGMCNQCTGLLPKANGWWDGNCFPEEIWRAFQQQTRTIAGRKPQLISIVQVLQYIASSRGQLFVLMA